MKGAPLISQRLKKRAQSPEPRTNRKKKRKGARSKEKDEERELIKSSMARMDRQ